LTTTNRALPTAHPPAVPAAHAVTSSAKPRAAATADAAPAQDGDAAAVGEHQLRFRHGRPSAKDLFVGDRRELLHGAVLVGHADA